MSWRGKHREMRHHERRSRWLIAQAARIERSARGTSWRIDFGAAAALELEAYSHDELAAEYRQELGL